MALAYELRQAVFRLPFKNICAFYSIVDAV